MKLIKLEKSTTDRYLKIDILIFSFILLTKYPAAVTNGGTSENKLITIFRDILWFRLKCQNIGFWHSRI